MNVAATGQVRDNNSMIIYVLCCDILGDYWCGGYMLYFCFGLIILIRRTKEHA